ADGHGGAGDQDRRPPAQPGLYRPGHPGLAAGHRSGPQQPVPLFGASVLDGGAQQGRRGPAAHAGRLSPALEIIFAGHAPDASETMRAAPPSAHKETVMKIALGPLQYYWPRVTTLEFYAAVCDWPVDIVYLGETVCSRRHELRLPDWIEVADMLAEAGKTPVLSTQVL